MNRRQFTGLAVGAIAGSFCAGIAASPYGRPVRDQLATGIWPTGDHCRSRLHEGPQDPGKPWPHQLTLAGSRLLKVAFLDALVDLLYRIEQRDTVVFGGGCDDGILAVRARRAHMGNLCCPIPGSPAADMDWLPVARDIKVVVTHPDNPVDSVSFGQLVDIARGRIRNWRTLGGPDRPIALVVHEHCETYYEPVRELLLNGGVPWSGHRLSATTDEDHLRQITRFPSSLGINSRVLATPLLHRGDLKVLKIDGLEPGVDNVTGGAYPLHGPFNIVYTQWNERIMRPFLDCLYSNEGRDVIRRMAVPITRDEAIESGCAGGYASSV